MEKEKEEKVIDLVEGMAMLPIVLERAFNEIAVTTDSGTILFGRTLDKLKDGLSAYFFQQRTGVPVMSLEKFPYRVLIRTAMQFKGKVGVKSVNAFQSDEDEALDLEKVDLGKLTNFTEELLRDWIEANKGMKQAVASGGVAVDAKVEKEIITFLHTAFKSEDERSLENLASFYGFQNSKSTEKEIATIREQIKAVINHNKDSFGIGGGPSPKVRRFKDSKGHATKSLPFAARAKRGSGDDKKELQRWSKVAKAAFGENNEKFFRQCKSEYRGVKTTKEINEAVITLGEARQWLESRGAAVSPPSQPSEVTDEGEEVFEDEPVFPPKREIVGEGYSQEPAPKLARR